MSNNIKNTKNNLTIIFTILVFIIILSLGITFFSAKYFKEIRIERIEFINLINFIDSGKLSVNEIIGFENGLNDNIFNKDLIKNNLKQIPSNNNFKPRGFINYFYFDKNNSIVLSNIKDDIEENFINNINKNDKFYNIFQTGGFLIKKFKLDDGGNFIILKKLRYSLVDYINDILGFIIINIIFALFLYFIGLKFVNKAFIPVEENLADMKEFIHNAGHELKTPISVIDSNIQLIDDMKIYDEEMTKELKREVLRLNSIIESLIKLSDIDLFKDLEKNNLLDSINEIINEFKFKISEKNIDVKINLAKNILIKSNKDYFYIFLSNIIGNAIKYNKNKGQIDISYKNGELIIKDSGIGIDKKNLDKIFDRFFKADKSRNTEGFGIGLSLVKKIADVYKWNIKVNSEKNKGTLFIIKFG